MYELPHSSSATVLGAVGMDNYLTVEFGRDYSRYGIYKGVHMYVNAVVLPKQDALQCLSLAERSIGKIRNDVYGSPTFFYKFLELPMLNLRLLNRKIKPEPLPVYRAQQIVDEILGATQIEAMNNMQNACHSGIYLDIFLRIRRITEAGTRPLDKSLRAYRSPNLTPSPLQTSSLILKLLYRSRNFLLAKAFLSLRIQ